MIALADNCLVFELANGDKVPFSPDMIAIDLMGDAAQQFDAEFVRHSANAVFYYFKHELGRESVTVAEFAEALSSVLRGFSLSAQRTTQRMGAVLETDLKRLALESGEACELFFFPRLREELRLQMRLSPRVLRFHNLRGCVKQLVGARRWNVRCRSLEEQIVEFLRECLTAETMQQEFSLLVDG
jgi:hypothetical protein